MTKISSVATMKPRGSEAQQRHGANDFREQRKPGSTNIMPIWLGFVLSLPVRASMVFDVGFFFAF